MILSGNAQMRPVALWLLICAVLVAVMVLLGGATRLTNSGLSMTRWQPFTLLPPLTEAEWRSTFAHYQLFPEYRLVNRGMGLEDFKSIFWLEYVHRLWGRLIGVVFLLPFLWFLIRGRIGPGLARRLFLLFLLGALQGALGWFMVQSGLVDQPAVSHYRLAVHLAVALLIFAVLLWTALDLLPPRPSLPMFRGPLLAVGALIGMTIVYGALVAGLDAGLVYNTFPLMNGRVIPENMWILDPLLKNLTENHGTVQWLHRLLATATVLTAVATGGAMARRGDHGGVWLISAVLLQAALGIATLLLAVPVPLGVAHQAGALALLTVVLVLTHAGRQAPVTRG